jgi:hypothetical protein
MIKTKKILLVTVISASFLFFNSCKKERIAADDYQDMESFYDDYKEAEQEYIIDSTGNCPLTCLKGTKICVSADMFSDSTGADITYPFILKVVELYSIKEMLLWRMPSIAGGNILETSAEIRVRTFKNGSELTLKPGKAYSMQMANMTVINNNMQVYFAPANDWMLATDTLSSVADSGSYYSLSVGKMGFVSAARLHNSTSASTTITLTVAGTNTQNIQSYLSFSNFKGLMRITNLTSGSVPVGEPVTLVAFAKKQTNDYVLHEQNFAVASNQQVPLSMQVVTLAALLSALAAL